MKITGFIALCLAVSVQLFPETTFAQSSAGTQGYFNDVSTFGASQGNFGTARIMAVGGGTTALGADISSISGNPAGLGLYKRGDFSFTPQINNFNSSTNYRDDKSRGNLVKMNIANLGFVFSNMKDQVEQGSFRGFSFGFAINRVRDLNSVQNFNGVANANVRTEGGAMKWNNVSYIDDISSLIGNNYYYGDIAKDGLRGALAQQAYDTYLIDTVARSGGLLSSYLPVSDMKQSGSLSTKGNTMSYDFSAGFNFYDKLFLGAGLSLLSHNYSSTYSITEQFTNIQLTGTQTNPSNLSYANASYTLAKSYNVTGTGYNARVGIIYLPIEQVRLGLSYTTPSYNYVTSSGNIDLSADYAGASYRGGAPLNKVSTPTVALDAYTYQVFTPAKISTGMSFFFPNNGFITVDADYLDYTSGVVQDISKSTLNNDNNFISKAYNSSVVNLRVGGELRIDANNYLRAGFGYYQSPYTTNYLNYSEGGYKRNNATSGEMKTYSAGYGYRNEDFYIDFSVVVRNTSQAFASHFYTPQALSFIRNTSFAITLGIPFN